MVLLLLTLFSGAVAFAEGEDAPQLQVTKEQLDAIEKEISTLRAEAARLAAQEHSIIASLDQFDVQIRLKLHEIQLLDLKQQRTQRDIDRLNEQYQRQMESLQQQKDYLSRRLVQAYKLGQLNYIKLMLQISSASDVLRGYQYISFLAKDDQRKVEVYRDSLQGLEQTRIRLEQEKRNLELLRMDSAHAHQALLRNRQEKVRFLASIQEQREVHLNAMSELKAAAAQLQRFFLGRESSAVEIPVGASMSQYKGLLNWPLVGTVTREFGLQKHPRFGTTTVNNGIEISAREGDEVRSVFSGRVVFAEWFKGYGLSVIIAHPGGMYSLYAHNSALRAQRGENVERGQVIAEAGSTGALGGPALYFEIRDHDQPVNPRDWLRRR